VPNFQEPNEAQPAQNNKRYKFHISRRAAGLVLAPLFLGMIVFSVWSWIYRDKTIDRGGSVPRQKINRQTGEAAHDTAKELLLPPVVTGIATPKSEETKNPIVTALPAEETKNSIVAVLPAEEAEKKKETPPADAPPKSQRGKYAIQIRAYPDNKKQDAISFLENVRKREADVSMETVHIAKRGVWHRILLGNFSTADEAADYRKKHRLARKHPGSFIQKITGNSP
jgi:hypothetical protein